MVEIQALAEARAATDGAMAETTISKLEVIISHVLVRECQIEAEAGVANLMLVQLPRKVSEAIILLIRSTTAMVASTEVSDQGRGMASTQNTSMVVNKTLAVTPCEYSIIFAVYCA